jgi:hypothetical protein
MELQARQHRISSMEKQLRELVQRVGTPASEPGGFPHEDAKSWNEYDGKVRGMAVDRFAPRTIALDAGIHRRDREHGRHRDFKRLSSGFGPCADTGLQSIRAQCPTPTRSERPHAGEQVS